MLNMDLLTFWIQKEQEIAKSVQKKLLITSAYFLEFSIHFEFFFIFVKTIHDIIIFILQIF